MSRGLPYPDGQAALRRSPTMAGNSGAGSLLHNFHQGRDGSTGGWKFQITSALRIRCYRNCASLALAFWTMCVSRSYRSLPKNTAHSKREPCGEGLGFQSRGLQNLTKRHARQQRIGRLPNTGITKKTPTPNPHRSAIRGTNPRSQARLSGSTYGFCTCHAKRTQRRNLGIHNRVSFAIFLGSCLGLTFPMAVVSCFGNGAHEHATRPSLSPNPPMDTD